MRRIFVIGGANIDIQGKSLNPLVSHDSNIGKLSYSFGGVARNIAENLVRLKAPVYFCSCFGGDAFGKDLKQNCLDLGMDLSLSIDCPEYNSSTYLAILDADNDMVIAINDMDIIEQLKEEEIDKVLEKTTEEDILFVDSNLSERTLEYLFKKANCPIAVDPISINKAVKLKNILSHITYFKPNHYEAAFLSGIEINDEKGIIENLKFFKEKGIKETIITMGSKGAYCLVDDKVYHYQPDYVDMVSATGAGDSFFAGYVFARSRNLSIGEAIYEGCIASKLCLESDKTVSLELSLEKINETKKTYYVKEEVLCTLK